MARLIECSDWVDTNSPAMHLHHNLSDDYVVVAGPVVHRQELDAVVVGPQGLFVLHDQTENGVEGVSANADAAEEEQPGERPDADVRVEEAGRAIRAFLADEFPDWTVELHHILVVEESTDEDETSSELPVVPVRRLAAHIGQEAVRTKDGLAEWQDRVDLAVALRDRRLTATQRASKPFVFRSGHGLGSSSEVWTIRDAVRTMDSDPESGIYHLRNETLAKWFHEEGADHLARLATRVVQEHSDPRVALETFLIGTGLVPRPALELRPREIDLGYALAGQSVARRFRLGKGPGRGYLFGHLEPSVPWLSVHPREFNSDERWTSITVRADTQSLNISPEALHEAIHVHSNASEEPVKVPVRLRVVSLPSKFNRRVLRPAAGFCAAAVVGAAAGWLLNAQGPLAGDFLRGLSWLPASPVAVWTVLVALLWGGAGAAHGLRQPRSWPVGYAMSRWWARTLVWAISLGVTGAAVRWAWAGLRGSDAPSLPARAAWALIIGPVALSILPSTIGAIRSGREMVDTSARAIRWSYLRPLVLSAGAALLSVTLRLGAPLLRPALQQIDLSAMLIQAARWIGDRISELETLIGGIIDELYLWYYEQ